MDETPITEHVVNVGEPQAVDTPPPEAAAPPDVTPPTPEEAPSLPVQTVTPQTEQEAAEETAKAARDAKAAVTPPELLKRPSEGADWLAQSRPVTKTPAESGVPEFLARPMADPTAWLQSSMPQKGAQETFGREQVTRYINGEIDLTPDQFKQYNTWAEGDTTATGRTAKGIWNIGQGLYAKGRDLIMNSDERAHAADWIGTRAKEVVQPWMDTKKSLEAGDYTGAAKSYATALATISKNLGVGILGGVDDIVATGAGFAQGAHSVSDELTGVHLIKKWAGIDDNAEKYLTARIQHETNKLKNDLYESTDTDPENVYAMAGALAPWVAADAATGGIGGLAGAGGRLAEIAPELLQRGTALAAKAGAVGVREGVGRGVPIAAGITTIAHGHPLIGAEMIAGALAPRAALSQAKIFGWPNRMIHAMADWPADKLENLAQTLSVPSKSGEHLTQTLSRGFREAGDAITEQATGIRAGEDAEEMSRWLTPDGRQKILPTDLPVEAGEALKATIPKSAQNIANLTAQARKLYSKADFIDKFTTMNKLGSAAVRGFTGAAGSVGEAALLGGAFGGAGAAPGDTEAIQQGANGLAMMAIPFSPLTAASGIHAARLADSARSAMALGKTPGAVVGDMTGVPKNWQDQIYKFAGMMRPMDKNIHIDTPDVMRKNLGLSESQTPGFGYVDDDGHMHINSTKIASGVAGHEFTHGTQQLLGEYVRKMNPEQMANFEANYGKQLAKTRPPSYEWDNARMEDVQGRVQDYIEFDGMSEEDALAKVTQEEQAKEESAFNPHAERDAEVGRYVLENTPIEMFYGGERGGDILKRWMGSLLGEGPIRTVPGGFNAPVTRGDVSAMKQRFFKVGEMAAGIRGGPEVPAAGGAAPVDPLAGITIPKSVAKLVQDQHFDKLIPPDILKQAVKDLGPNAAPADVLIKAFRMSKGEAPGQPPPVPPQYGPQGPQGIMKQLMPEAAPQTEEFRRWSGNAPVILNSGPKTIRPEDMGLQITGNDTEGYTVAHADGSLAFGGTWPKLSLQQAADAKSRLAVNMAERAQHNSQAHNFQTGQPVVVGAYHGTPSDAFHTFDESKLGEYTGAKSAKQGFFFSGLPDTAESYKEGLLFPYQGFKDMTTQQRGQLATRMMDYMMDEARGPKGMWRIESHWGSHKEGAPRNAPMERKWAIVTQDGTRIESNLDGDMAEKKQNEHNAAVKFYSSTSEYANDNPELLKGLATQITGKELDMTPADTGHMHEVYVKMQNPYVYDFRGNPYREQTYYDLLKSAKAAGHDGAIFTNTYDGGGKPDNIFVTFDNKNIKSTANMGTFDPSNPDIRYMPEVNIGMHVGGVEKLTAKDIADALEAVPGVKIAKLTEQRKKGMEPTVVATLSRALTAAEGDAVSRALGQDAIAQHQMGGQGNLFGPKTQDYGGDPNIPGSGFNPDYFVTHEGKKLSDVIQRLPQRTGASGIWDRMTVDPNYKQGELEKAAEATGANPKERFTRQTPAAQKAIQDYFKGKGEAQYMPEQWFDPEKMDRGETEYDTPGGFAPRRSIRGFFLKRPEEGLAPPEPWFNPKTMDKGAPDTEETYRGQRGQFMPSPAGDLRWTSRHFDMTPDQLEQFLIFGRSVAGHASKDRAPMIERALTDLLNTQGGTSPITALQKLNQTEGGIEAFVRKHGFGPYGENIRFLKHLAESRIPDLKTATEEELQNIPGIGPKTARFFKAHTDATRANNVMLDTHILRFLRETGYPDAPTSTPQDPKVYEKYSNAFRDTAAEFGLTPSDLDLQIWLDRSGNMPTASYKGLENIGAGRDQFMPSPHPDAIKEPAIRTPDGEVIHAPVGYHSMIPLTKDQRLQFNKLEMGFISNKHTDEKPDFMNRTEALARALKHKQISEAAADPRNWTETAIDQQLHAPDVKEGSTSVPWQYMPSPHPEAIKSAATRNDENGKIYTGSLHYQADQKMFDESSPKKFTHGYVTKQDKFLNRDQASEHAKRIGQITTEEYRDAVSERTGIDPEELPDRMSLDAGAFRDSRRFMPDVPSDTRLKDALSEDKVAKIGAHRDLPKGTPVSLRIDIPAYNKTGDYAVTVHDRNIGKVHGYDGIATVDNPTFYVQEKGAQKVKEGMAKYPMAAVNGDFNPSRTIPKDIEDYTKVGFNPVKHSYFYDKATGDPVISGDKAISAGNTVFVKNPVYGNPTGFLYMPDTPMAIDRAAIRRLSDKEVITGGQNDTHFMIPATSGKADDYLGPNGHKLYEEGFVDHNKNWYNREQAHNQMKAMGQLPPQYQGEYANEANVTDLRKARAMDDQFMPTTPEAAHAETAAEAEAHPEAKPLRWRLDKNGQPDMIYNKKTEQKEAKPIEEGYNLAKQYLAEQAAEGKNKLDAHAAKIEVAKDKLKEFYNVAKANPEAMQAKGWYRELKDKLLDKLGGNEQDLILFTRLLATTSPNTNPGVNFGFALDAWNRFQKGEYKDVIDKYNKALAEFYQGKLEHSDGKPVVGLKQFAGYLYGNDIIPYATGFHEKGPQKGDPKKLGMHSLRVLDTISDHYDRIKGLKINQFAHNLAQTDLKSTIDLWAARTLHRLLNDGNQNPWRILPKNEKGISDADFHFAQEAFVKAAEELKMSPDDLQAILWFAEKIHYDKQGWSIYLDKGDFRPLVERMEPDVHPKTFKLKDVAPPQ